MIDVVEAAYARLTTEGHVSVDREILAELWEMSSMRHIVDAWSPKYQRDFLVFSYRRLAR